ncbi:class A beta-lactamase BOR-1 [Marinobacter nanhaiticus D15-8W]|uniref:Beta-lactamase n=1 Tax=Marinobacter nanhaiticus D15-8W TaxID=626887 RepID=N6VZT2_9GAMM|nr:class A beta-lactamase [Marinobacter nanhaiticus]ENO15785.1 class A beta-lactamase [Marinobacter nanhaiticus D15-8W]BES73357.1 class A beta-lactamase BOR-1 [Marinobacter nanhaiticus D15-8W]
MQTRPALTLASFLVFLFVTTMAVAQTELSRAEAFTHAVADLESAKGGRLGVAVWDTETGDRFGHRADERFAMTSTFKWVLVAAVLSRVDAGEETLDRQVRYDDSDILSYAPIAKQHLPEGEMTVAELSDAAIRYSDNTAANLLLETLGGPEGLTDYMRTLGDEVSRLDRYEPELNANLPGDERDTTTPSAMLNAMQAALVGDALSPASKKRLHDWLIRNTTGDAKLRAGLDPDWTVGDKTGSGARGASNDVAIVWHSDGGPILIAVYYSDSALSNEAQSAVHAEVGRLVTATVRHGND